MSGSLAGMLAALGVALGAVLASPAALAQEPQTLPKVRLNAGIHNIDAQFARTPQQREVGLMFRRDMPVNEGMLFVFEQAGQQCFWMKNTLIPLQTAFIADDGAIVNVVDMKPQTLDSHCSQKPVRYVLEMNAGWFAKHGLKPGSRISGLPSAP